MLTKKAVGRNGGALKYDLLTVLAAWALAQDKTVQRRALRLSCLITARYNWQNDELSTGQAEIARLWSVDPRTVKREMAAFRTCGWLIEKRPAARGRVALYGLGIARILEDTRPAWAHVGPDLVGRLTEPEAAVDNGAAGGAQVIPFPPVQSPLPEGQTADTLWGRVTQRLMATDAAAFRTWFAGLEAEETGDELILSAPGGFHASYLRTHFAARIEAILAALAPGRRLVIRAGGPGRG